MQFRLLVAIVTLASLARVGIACSGDNCANHVTGVWGGIGVSIEPRISLCNSFLKTTIKPPTKTITTTIHKYTSGNIITSQPADTSTVTTTPDETVTPSLVPTFASAQCPEKGQFSSACSCWDRVSPGVTTLPTPTATVTTTAFHQGGCGPAATAVKAGDNSYFPCSRQLATCSCLKSGHDNICVRIGPFSGSNGNINSGPCGEVDECDSGGSCKNGYVCVFDGSCSCGKHRCYKAAPMGCEYQGLPPDDTDMKKGPGFGNRTLRG